MSTHNKQMYMHMYMPTYNTASSMSLKMTWVGRLPPLQRTSSTHTHKHTHTHTHTHRVALFIS